MRNDPDCPISINQSNITNNYYSNWDCLTCLQNSNYSNFCSSGLNPSPSSFGFNELAQSDEFNEFRRLSSSVQPRHASWDFPRPIRTRRFDRDNGSHELAIISSAQYYTDETNYLIHANMKCESNSNYLPTNLKSNSEFYTFQSPIESKFQSFVQNTNMKLKQPGLSNCDLFKIENYSNIINRKIKNINHPTGSNLADCVQYDLEKNLENEIKFKPKENMKLNSHLMSKKSLETTYPSCLHSVSLF